MLPLDQYYFDQEEPLKGALLALRDVILAFDQKITHEWKYRIPFFCYDDKMLCYLWTDKKTKEPYIGIVDGHKIDHPLLEQGKRARMKILRIDSAEDLPIELIHEILTESINHCRNRKLKF